MKNVKEDYYLATNDKTGKTVVVVPLASAIDAFDAMKVANKYFKVKKEDLHCVSGIMNKAKGKIESRDRLSGPVNCWMVWR